MSANLKNRSSALVQHTCILRTKIISYLKGHGLNDLCKYADSFYTAEVRTEEFQTMSVYPTQWSMTHNNCTLFKKVMKYNYR